MPILDGESAARMIKSTNNVNQTTPIVAVTSYELSAAECQFDEQNTVFSAVSFFLVGLDDFTHFQNRLCKSQFQRMELSMSYENWAFKHSNGKARLALLLVDSLHPKTLFILGHTIQRLQCPCNSLFFSIFFCRFIIAHLYYATRYISFTQNTCCN